MVEQLKVGGAQPGDAGDDVIGVVGRALGRGIQPWHLQPDAEGFAVTAREGVEPVKETDQGKLLQP